LYVLKDTNGTVILLHIYDERNFLTMTQPSASLSDIGTTSKIFCAQFIRFINVTLFLGLINKAQRCKDAWESEGTTPQFSTSTVDGGLRPASD
jgi:hypothetical protein